MTESREGHEDLGNRELEMVAYVGEFRIVGTAHFGGGRASSRRASDYIRAFSEPRLTLSDVRIYSKSSRQLLEMAPFIILNLDKVDFLFAREGNDEAPDGEAPPADDGEVPAAT